MNNNQKKLESLFAWAEFYRTNQKYSELEKCQRQIEVLRDEMNQYRKK